MTTPHAEYVINKHYNTIIIIIIFVVEVARKEKPPLNVVGDVEGLNAFIIVSCTVTYFMHNNVLTALHYTADGHRCLQVSFTVISFVQSNVHCTCTLCSVA